VTVGIDGILAIAFLSRALATTRILLLPPTPRLTAPREDVLAGGSGAEPLFAPLSRPGMLGVGGVHHASAGLYARSGALKYELLFFGMPFLYFVLLIGLNPYLLLAIPPRVFHHLGHFGPLDTGKAATATAPMHGSSVHDSSTASKGESKGGAQLAKGESQSAKVAELTKSLYYYKKRSRELRRMLEACTSSGVVVTDPFGEHARARGGGAGGRERKKSGNRCELQLNDVIIRALHDSGSFLSFALLFFGLGGKARGASGQFCLSVL